MSVVEEVTENCCVVTKVLGLFNPDGGLLLSHKFTATGPVST